MAKYNQVLSRVFHDKKSAELRLEKLLRVGVGLLEEEKKKSLSIPLIKYVRRRERLYGTPH